MERIRGTRQTEEMKESNSVYVRYRYLEIYVVAYSAEDSFGTERKA